MTEDTAGRKVTARLRPMLVCASMRCMVSSKFEAPRALRRAPPHVVCFLTQPLKPAAGFYERIKFLSRLAEFHCNSVRSVSFLTYRAHLIIIIYFLAIPECRSHSSHLHPTWCKRFQTLTVSIIYLLLNGIFLLQPGFLCSLPFYCASRYRVHALRFSAALGYGI